MSEERPRGLYRPEFEHDACGIGALAHLKGERSHRMVDDALSVLVNLEHRGGKGLEPNTGDGAGILFQVPHRFFRKEAQKCGHLLPDEGDFRNACESLDAVGWRVDYVLTHDCPSACKLSVMLPPSLYSLGDYGESARWKDDRLNGYLDEIDARLDYKAWYFGHYHTNAACVDGRHACLYRDIVQLGDLPR